MNHKYVTLGIAAIIAVIAVTAVGYAVPQQAFAHKHNDGGVKVKQSIDQANQCSGPSPDQRALVMRLATTICLNNGNNSADIQR